MIIVIIRIVAAIVLGYLIGSIPFGVIIGKRFTGVDIRNYGSGKMGTTNVLRTAGTKAAICVMLLDIIKGVLAVIFAGLIIGNNFVIIGNIGLSRAVCQVQRGLPR